jgi:hypothetical protein
MNKLYGVSGLIIAVGAIALMVTNPNEAAYQEYGAIIMSEELKEQGCSKIPPGLGDFLKLQCQNLVEKLRPDLQQLIANNTQRKNYLILSIYETNLTPPQPLPSYHFQTLAAFNNFWILKAEEQNSSN